MWWRISRKQFREQQGDDNRQAMQAIVQQAVVSGAEAPGILAYVEGQPAGWCSVAPREQFASLNRSPVLRAIDDRPVWSLVCLFVGKPFRRQGLSLALIRAACAHAVARGARIVEAYPTVPRGVGRLPPVSSFMGLPAVYEQAGFVEVARPSPSRAIMRYVAKA
jgi:GNAT superfamily N-acetyltransferase